MVLVSDKPQLYLAVTAICVVILIVLEASLAAPHVSRAR